MDYPGRPYEVRVTNDLNYKHSTFSMKKGHLTPDPGKNPLKNHDLLAPDRSAYPGPLPQHREDIPAKYLFCTLAVSLRHDREETLRPRCCGGYTNPLHPAYKAVSLHLPEPWKDVVMRDPQELCKFTGRGKTYGDAVRGKPDVYAAILLKKDPYGRIDDIVLFVWSHPIATLSIMALQKKMTAGELRRLCFLHLPAFFFGHRLKVYNLRPHIFCNLLYLNLPEVRPLNLQVLLLALLFKDSNDAEPWLFHTGANLLAFTYIDLHLSHPIPTGIAVDIRQRYLTFSHHTDRRKDHGGTV